MRKLLLAAGAFLLVACGSADVSSEPVAAQHPLPPDQPGLIDSVATKNVCQKGVPATADIQVRAAYASTLDVTTRWVDNYRSQNGAGHLGSNDRMRVANKGDFPVTVCWYYSAEGWGLPSGPLGLDGKPPRPNPANLACYMIDQSGNPTLLMTGIEGKGIALERPHV